MKGKRVEHEGLEEFWEISEEHIQSTFHKDSWIVVETFSEILLMS